MRSTFQNSTRLLSILIRLSSRVETSSTPLCSPKRSIRFLLPSRPRHFGTDSQRNGQASSEEGSSQSEADAAGTASIEAGSRRNKVTVRNIAEDIEEQSDAQVLPRKRAHKSKSGSTAPWGIASSTKRPEPPRTQQAEDINFQRPREHWQIQKEALKKKFGEQGWSPRKKLSPDAMEGIRALHEQYPDKYTTPVLAEQFKVSPEVIRRILKSKWRPSADKLEERRARWAKRHDRIWDAQAEMGLRPKRTKDRKPEGPEKLNDIIPFMPDVG
jgi:Neugrin